MEKVEVRIAAQPKKYSIHIGYGFLGDACKTIAKSRDGSRLAVITDSKVKGIYGNAVLAALRKHGAQAELFSFPAGEKSKTRETKARLEDQMFSKGYGRDSTVVAVGGGVVGDVAGFVAATYMRGIPHIQLPTTVVAQGDSSIGGKTAVDVPAGKNLVGAFHDPLDIFMDVKTLETLDDKNYRTGLTEIIKHGIIADAAFFGFIEKNLGTILSRKTSDYPRVMVDLMRRNCAIKNAVVSADATEKNRRKILNYGHTIAHAIEPLLDYSLTHGEAVSIGIACEAFISHRLGYCSKDDYEKQVDLFEEVRLPTRLPDGISPKRIMEKMRLDKKARQSEPEFVLLEKIGKTKDFNGKAATKIPEATLLKLLNEFRSA